jgi:hypothetical protein
MKRLMPDNVGIVMPLAWTSQPTRQVKLAEIEIHRTRVLACSTRALTTPSGQTVRRMGSPARPVSMTPSMGLAEGGASMWQATRAMGAARR